MRCGQEEQRRHEQALAELERWVWDPPLRHPVTDTTQECDYNQTTVLFKPVNETPKTI